VVDDQGDRVVCVEVATSKAILAGLWHSKWTKSRFVADQEFVIRLLQEDKDDKLAAINPTLLHGRNLGIQNEEKCTGSCFFLCFLTQKQESSKWAEFVMEVKELTKKEFLSTWHISKKEYLVGYLGHCLYVERVEKDGEELCCLKSWGDKNDTSLIIPTLRVEDGSIYSVELLPALSPDDIRVGREIRGDTL